MLSSVWSEHAGWSGKGPRARVLWTVETVHFLRDSGTFWQLDGMHLDERSKVLERGARVCESGHSTQRIT